MNKLEVAKVAPDWVPQDFLTWLACQGDQKQWNHWSVAWIEYKVWVNTPNPIEEEQNASFIEEFGSVEPKDYFAILSHRGSEGDRGSSQGLQEGTQAEG